jgi:signal transduction histidine kinase
MGSGGTGRPADVDLQALNRWLNVTRLRAVAILAVIVTILDRLHPGVFALPTALAICGLGAAASIVGLRWRALDERPQLLFALQAAFDTTIVTLGLWLVSSGLPALLFRSLYVIVIVPVGLVTVGGGLATAAAASLAHLGLLTAEHGSLAVVASLEGLVPTVAFFLVAQQCFFYGAHLDEKNRRLAALAERLEEHRRELADEARTSAALVDIARTLSRTLDAGELLARVTRIMSEYLGADWGGIFLVDPARGTYRIVGATDLSVPLAELERIDFPVAGWLDVDRLAADGQLVLAGAAVTRVPAALTGGRALGSVVVAALRPGETLGGFLAVGFATPSPDTSSGARRLVAGMAEHAATVLHNARLLSELKLAAELKSEFVGAVSHELRSPLNVIIGYTEMLRDGELGPVSPEQVAALARSHQQAVTLLEMITALLDLNRLEAGRLPIRPSAVDVPGLLAELGDEIPAAWRRHEVELRMTTSGALPPLVTDRGKLKTILRNLLHNALKFTARGCVTVEARPGQAGETSFVVRDTGAGIPADAMPYVFEMFRQVPGTGGGGVGLGLHIVRRLVDALGGRVEVASTVGVGTTFVVTVPSASEAPAAAA